MPLGCLTPSQTGWLWVPSAASWGLSPATCWCGLGLEMPRKGWEERNGPREPSEARS